MAETLSEALAAAGLSLRLSGPEAAAISEAIQGPPATRPDPCLFWGEFGRIADPSEPPLTDEERWEHVWRITMGMVGATSDPPLCTLSELQNVAHLMDEAFADVDAGVRWDKSRWDEANARVLLAEVPGCELSAEELGKLLERGRVPAHMEAEARQALAEKGTLAASETQACRWREKLVSDVVLSGLERALLRSGKNGWEAKKKCCQVLVEQVENPETVFLMPQSPSAGVSGPNSGGSVVRPQKLSHGTIACRDIERSRKFYEEFLGLEVVHFIPPAMMLRLGTNVYIACVCLGEKVPQNTVWSHFGFNVGSREEVDLAHEAALHLKDEYELLNIEKPHVLHGAYQFYLQDRDSNWWEIQYEPRTIDDFFAMPDLDPV